MVQRVVPSTNLKKRSLIIIKSVSAVKCPVSLRTSVVENINSRLMCVSLYTSDSFFLGVFQEQYKG